MGAPGKKSRRQAPYARLRPKVHTRRIGHTSDPATRCFGIHDSSLFCSIDATDTAFNDRALSRSRRHPASEGLSSSPADGVISQHSASQPGVDKSDRVTAATTNEYVTRRPRWATHHKTKKPIEPRPSPFLERQRPRDTTATRGGRDAYRAPDGPPVASSHA